MILPARILAVVGADLAGHVDLHAVLFEKADRAFDLAVEFENSSGDASLTSRPCFQPRTSEFALSTQFHIAEENRQHPGIGRSVDAFLQGSPFGLDMDLILRRSRRAKVETMHSSIHCKVCEPFLKWSAKKAQSLNHTCETRKR